jgi:hypothetical protein
MKRLVLGVLCALMLPSAAMAQSKAGVAVVDATWHVGASGGQYADDGPPTQAPGIDPYTHSTKKRISDGVGLRTSVRALVIEDAKGDRVAIVSHDLYLPQDLLQRRLGSILEAKNMGITGENLAMTASHNHNTPYYSTPGWGTAVFQDVIDLRFYEYMAQQMAKAVVKADKGMRPVRMGGATRTFDAIQSHTYGPKVGDDGTPAGQPYSHTTRQLTVLRFDDVSDPKHPKPYANWVVFGVHPEYTWGYDLINGDITHAAARMVDRENGTKSVFSQRETGASGPHKDARVHPLDKRREFQDGGFGQLDRAARLLADAIEATLKDIGTGTPERDAAYSPFRTDFDVNSVSIRVAPPATRPYPGVSNCNTYALFHGDPRIPVAGLPDCESTNATGPLTPVTAPMYDQLKEAGVPIPESYSATKLTAVEETAAVHLMAIKLGGVGVTVCPCELFTDTALNIETRLNKIKGDLWDGFDWAALKTPAGRDWCIRTPPAQPGTWVCANPQNPATDLAPISDLLYRRFRAQIHNDATGWETDLATLGSEAEPNDPALIKGNFTKEEFPDHGYDLVVAVGMGNDYWGYQPEYREMRSHDHYRKALNGLGLHGSDFLATRLTRLASGLNGGPGYTLSPLDMAMLPEQARARAVSEGLGAAATAYTKAYEPTLPAEGEKPAIVTQPKDITRFAGAHVSWIGGSNYTDLPDVRVERRTGGKWRRYGDTTGDVQLMVDFPTPQQLPDWRTGSFSWKWTAAFEAFSSDVKQPDLRGKARRSTPAGEYRFVIRGRHRDAGAYTLTSAPFTVSPWSGVRVSDLKVDGDGRASFADPGAIDYPDSYKSPFRFIDPARNKVGNQEYCRRCSFRPWLDRGTLESAVVSGVEAERGADGRWRTVEPIEGDAVIAAGDLRTESRETNGEDIR